MLDVQVTAEDLSEAAKALMDLPGIFQRAKAAALASVGYQLQQELKMEAKRSLTGAGYLHWPPLNPHTGVMSRTHDKSGRYRGLGYKTTRYKTGDRKGQVIYRGSTRTQPFSRLINAVRYAVDDDDSLVEIGFIERNAKLYQMLNLAATGFETTVTPRMRKHLFGSGFPLKAGTTTLKTPARPWVEPVRKATEGKVFQHFEAKFLEAIERYQSGGSVSSGKGWAS